jgi:hypothetical protein
MKICLIGLPRCGSQYISAMIAETFPGMNNIVEPYTKRHIANIVNIDNWVRVKRMPDDFATHQERIDYVSKILKSGRPDQSLVMKLFLTDDMYPFLKEIIDTLKTLNFKFIVVKRENVEHHLLSHCVAMVSNKWSSLDSGIHSRSDKFKITDLADIDWLYRQISNFEKIVSDLGIEYTYVRYEHAVNDLAQALNMPINTDVSIQKQIVGDPWDLIENSDEIKEIIQKVFNGTHLY